MSQTPLTTEQQESAIIEYGLSPAAFNALTPIAMHTLYEAIGIDNKVIAAAPELLEALENLLASIPRADYEKHDANGAKIHEAIRTISQAKGK